MPGSTPKPMPWSVKGVSDEAREIAKQAAAEHGMTIGDWLSTVIGSDLAGCLDDA